MLKIYNELKYSTKVKTIAFVIIFLALVLIDNKVSAANVRIIGPSKINVGDTATIKVDFGTYIGAIDLFELTYNSRILEYTGTEELYRRCWFDNSTASTGIKEKEFIFKGKKNGTASISVNIKGLYSANSLIDELGDCSIGKSIVVGTGIEAGDINNDNKINSTDAAIVLDKYKNGGITKTDLQRGDVNEDGLLNSYDAVMILDIFKNV